MLITVLHHLYWHQLWVGSPGRLVCVPFRFSASKLVTNDVDRYRLYSSISFGAELQCAAFLLKFLVRPEWLIVLPFSWFNLNTGARCDLQLNVFMKLTYSRAVVLHLLKCQSALFASEWCWKKWFHTTRLHLPVFESPESWLVSRGLHSSGCSLFWNCAFLSPEKPRLFFPRCLDA